MNESDPRSNVHYLGSSENIVYKWYLGFLLSQNWDTSYQLLFHPYLSFGLVVWGRTSKTNLEKILIPTERALRLIYFSSNFEHAIPARIWDKITKYLKSKPKESFKENLRTESLQILEREGVYADVYNISD